MPTSSPVFGPIIIASDVEEAMTSTLKLWLPGYLAELERRTDREPQSIPMVRAWGTTNHFMRRAQEQTPAGIVIAPGTTGQPERHGDGTIDLWWRIGVAIVVSASTREATNELAKLYAAAIRTIVAQKPDLDGFAERTVLVGETTDDVPAEYLEVGATAQVEFDVLVAGCVDASAGPIEPTIDPPPAWPVITEQHVDIELEAPLG